MVNEMINKREKIAIDDVGEGPIVFLYRNPCGRVILKVATLPTVSKIAGWFMDRKHIQQIGQLIHIQQHLIITF